LTTCIFFWTLNPQASLYTQTVIPKTLSRPVPVLMILGDVLKEVSCEFGLWGMGPVVWGLSYSE